MMGKGRREKQGAKGRGIEKILQNGTEALRKVEEEREEVMKRN